MTTSTKRLTTAELRQIIDSHEKGHAMIVPINCDYLAAKELLAVREAQSVVVGENCWSCGKYFTYAQHSECEGYCPYCNAPVDLEDDEDQPSPAVPEEVAAALDWIDDFIARCNGDDRGACNSVNVLRAAMLQPVSQGYTLPDGYRLVPVEPTEDMVAKAWREALGKCDHETIKRMYATMLAAAPTPTKAVNDGNN